MFRLALIAAAGLSLCALPAAAQSWSGTYDSGHGDRAYQGGHGRQSHGDGYGSHRSNAVPSNFDWRSQLDRPGDYRCDQFWDANRENCEALWRDQRRQASPQARRDYRELAGTSGYSHGRYGYSGRRGYGSAQDYGHARGSTTYHGAYGRPDHVYPGGGYNSGYGSRADWCRATYRSYDPRTGYYRAYSGHLVYCG